MRTDDVAADAAAARQRAVTKIRNRVAAVAGSWLSASACVQIAIACATRDPKELLDVLFSSQVARAVSDPPVAKLIAITEREWKSLFGATGHATRSGPLEQLVLQPSFRSTAERLGVSLRCTICESSQSKLWARLWTRTACFVALHMNECEDLIGTSIGGVVRADSRRLEDMRAELEDNGFDSLLVSHAIVALADTAT